MLTINIGVITYGNVFPYCPSCCVVRSWNAHSETLSEDCWWLLTPSVLLTQVGEPPDVAQAYREANLGQDVLELAVPGRTFLLLTVWAPFLHIALFPFPFMVVDDQRALLEGIVAGVLVGKQVFDRLCDIVVKLSLDGLAVFGHLIKQTRAKGGTSFWLAGWKGRAGVCEKSLFELWLCKAASLRVFWGSRASGVWQFMKVEWAGSGILLLFLHYHQMSLGRKRKHSSAWGCVSTLSLRKHIWWAAAKSLVISLARV